jgi:DNA-binding NtrC family response regulator
MSEIQTTSSVNNIAINQKNISNKRFGFKQSNVMIIEGDKSIHGGLINLLQDWHCNTQCFNSAEEAISVLEQQVWKPRIIISGLNLNDDKFGVDSIKLIQERNSCDIPIIVFIDDTDLIRTQFVFTFLYKPINAAQLRFVMNKKMLMHSPQ